MVGIAGQSSEKLRVYRTLMHPFGAPDWDHRPFKEGNQPVAQPCFELGDPVGGKFESTSLAPDGRGLAYGVGDGIWVAPLDCASPSAGRLAIPGGRFPDWGPADVPAVAAKPRVRASRTKRALALTVTHRGGRARQRQGAGRPPHDRLGLGEGRRVGQGKAADQAPPARRARHRQGGVQAGGRRRGPAGHPPPLAPTVSGVRTSSRAGAAASRNGLTTSMGSGNTTVEFWVAPISVSVCM